MAIKNLLIESQRHLIDHKQISVGHLEGVARVMIDHEEIGSVRSGGKANSSKVIFNSPVLGVTRGRGSADCYFNKDEQILVLGEGRVDIIARLKDNDLGCDTTMRVRGDNLSSLGSNDIQGTRKIRETTRRVSDL